MVMQRLDSEIIQMQLSMKISDDQTKLLHDAGEEALVRWTKEQDPQALFGVKGIPQPVLDAVMVKSDRRLGIAVTNRYRNDLVLKKKLHQAIGVDGAVTILDQVLALNQKQNSQVRQLLSVNWQQQWLNRVLTSGSERINILRPALASFTPTLKKILTPPQFRALKTRHPSSSRALMAQMEPSEVEAATEIFRKKSQSELQGTVAVRVEELTHLCSLDSDQVALLEETGKVVVRELAEKLGETFRNLKVKGPGAAGPEAWQLISSNLFLLIEQSSTWQENMNRLLSNDQRARWDDRQAERQKRWSDSAIGGIAALLGQQHRFTAKQTADFIKVLREEIDPTRVWSINDHYREMKEIDFDKFKGIFSDGQQVQLSEVFEKHGKR